MKSRSKVAEKAESLLRDVEPSRGSSLPGDDGDSSATAGKIVTGFALLRKMVASGKSVHSKANDK